MHKRTCLALVVFLAVSAHCGGKVIVDGTAGAGGHAGVGGAVSTGGMGGDPRGGKIDCGDTVCDAPALCLDDQGGPPGCVAPDGGAAPCFVCVFATCDGNEDCGPDEICTEFFPDNAKGFTCLPGGSDCPWNPMACHADSECPACHPSCLPFTIKNEFFGGIELVLRACQ